MVLVILVFIDIFADHCGYGAVIPLDLTIRLRLVCGNERVRSSEELLYCLEELGAKLFAVIGKNRIQ